MANKEHLALLKQGVEIWNQWRNEHESIVPDLSGVDLSGADLSGVNLSGADLSGADLTGAILGKTIFSGATLSGANLSGLDLTMTEFILADLTKANLSGVDLRGANLSGADLSEANLSGAKLIGADPNEANLSGFHLRPEFRLRLTRISPEPFNTSLLDEIISTTRKPVVVFTEMTVLDQVQFSAYYPREAQTNTRYSFLLYAHTKEAFEQVADDVEKFRDELGNKVPPPKTAKQTTQIRLDTPITIVPESEQIEFDPPSLTKKWGGEWTRFGFDFKPTQAMSGDTLFIRASVQVATVEVAHINCAVEVIEEKRNSPSDMGEAESPLEEAKLNSNTFSLYQTIFISYSRKDKEVVKVYKLVQEAVGNIAFKDTDSIRAGEDWRSALALAIDQADIFQLFWSDNSAGSPNVRDEWEYTLKYKCPENRCVGFIRPVCWNDPIKPSPPEELGHLHFKYVPLDELVAS